MRMSSERKYRKNLCYCFWWRQQSFR